MTTKTTEGTPSIKAAEAVKGQKIEFANQFMGDTFIVVKPFVAVVRRSGFAPFAWYRIVLGAALLAALAAGWS